MTYTFCSFYKIQEMSLLPLVSFCQSRAVYLDSFYPFLMLSQQVEVSFYTPSGCCGESNDPSVPSVRTLDINGEDSQSLKFVIMPVEVGDMPIRVMVASNLGNDGVQKMLKVIVSCNLLFFSIPCFLVYIVSTLFFFFYIVSTLFFCVWYT